MNKQSGYRNRRELHSKHSNTQTLEHSSVKKASGVRVVDRYYSGIWDRERALQEIRAYPNYDSIAE